MENGSEVSDIEYGPAPNPGEQKPSTTIMQPLRSQLSALWAFLGLDLPTVLMMLKLAQKIYPHPRRQVTDHGTEAHYLQHSEWLC
jgi:hypothetical protein